MAKKQNALQSLNQFIERLIEEKKFTNLEPAVRLQIKKDLSERVDDHINLALVENMPPVKMAEFDKILDTADAKKINIFCRKNIPDLEAVIANTLVRFRATYLGL